MELLELLRQRQSAIKQRWISLIIATYPPDSRGFFLKQKNRFLNPVGAALSRQADALYDLLLDNSSQFSVPPEVEEFLKVRAVQDFEPSQAVGFILYLKQAIRAELADEINTPEQRHLLHMAEGRIDQMLLAAFDSYMKSREKIYEIKANELRRRSYLALRQTQGDVPDYVSDTPTEVTG
jgi:hypothetical protein